MFIVLSFFCFFQNNLDILKQVEHGYSDNKGVKIHYVTMGKGPLVIFLHGFPDYWLTWRDQILELSKSHQVVAIDLRAYNKSDHPKGLDNFRWPFLISDVASVINHFPQKKATIVGHDWGGAIAWQVALWRPKLVEKLIVLSTPHPNGLAREFATNSKQKKNSQYARDYKKDNAYKNLTAEKLSSWVKDLDVRKEYVKAFKRSDFEGMLNYYKANFNFKKKPNQSPSSGVKKKKNSKLKKIQCPTLGIFGLKDKALLASGWNDTWDWVDNVVTLVSIPNAGHFVQQDASEKVSQLILEFLNRE